MKVKELIQELKNRIGLYPEYANYSVRVVEGITERTSNDDHEAEVNYWVSHIEVRESITDDPTNGEIIIYSNE